jgi:very-short-patch-repair endonuclease
MPVFFAWRDRDHVTRPDFFYTDAQMAVYIDGPVHDQPDIAAEDQAITERLTWEAGLTVIRFRHDADWRAICTEYTGVFGKCEAQL